MGERCNCCGYENDTNARYCKRCNLPLFIKEDSSNGSKGTILSKIRKLLKKDRGGCPKCGNKLEILLPKMEFEDPSVYKCNNCRCTFTTGGTSKVKANGKMLPSWSKQENIISLQRGEIKFVGKVHGSVGWEYELIYPQWAFSANRNITYHHPEMMKAGMCGGDEATVEYTLKPLKTGLFCITEEIHFRGNLEECHIHYFLVE